MTFLPIVCSIKDVSLYACNIHEQSSELTTFLSHKSDRNLLGSELLTMVTITKHLSKHYRANFTQCLQMFKKDNFYNADK